MVFPAPVGAYNADTLEAVSELLIELAKDQILLIIPQVHKAAIRRWLGGPPLKTQGRQVFSAN